MSPTAPATVTGSDFEELLQRVENALKDATGGAQVIIDAGNAAIGLLGPFGAGLEAVLQEFADLVTEFLAQVGHYLSGVGQPWTLSSTGSAWNDQVAAAAGSTSAAIKHDTVSQTYWTGTAADAYVKVIADQTAALEEIRNAGQELQDILTKASWTIYGLWAAIVIAVIALVIEYAGEGAATATGAGAVVGIPAAVVSTLKAIAAVAALVGAATGAMTLLNGGAKDLQQRITGNPAFPDGRWPGPRDGFSSTGSWTPKPA
jgi:hypothetical protein